MTFSVMNVHITIKGGIEKMYLKKIEYLRSLFPADNCISAITVVETSTGAPVGTPCIINMNPFTINNKSATNSAYNNTISNVDARTVYNREGYRTPSNASFTSNIEERVVKKSEKVYA